MAIELTCMSCWSSFTTEDGNRGRTVACPKCAADVKVPGTAPAGSAPDPEPELLTPADVPPAEPPPLPKPAVKMAKAVSRPAAPPPPAAADDVFAGTSARAAKSGERSPPPADDGDDVFSESERRSAGQRAAARRSDDDDEEDEADDDTPRRRPAAGSKTGSNVLKILAVLFMCFTIFCILPVGYFVYQGYSAYREITQRADDGAFDDMEFDEDGNPVVPMGGEVAVPPGGTAATKKGPAVVTPSTAPKKALPLTEWQKQKATFPPQAEQAKEGFAAQMPADSKTTRSGGVAGGLMDGEIYNVLTYTGTEGSLEYKASAYEMTGKAKLTAEQFVRAVLSPATTFDPGSKPHHITGHLGVELTGKRGGRTPETVRAVRVGNKVFVFSVHHDPDRDAEFQGMAANARRTIFLNFARVTATEPGSPAVTPPMPPTPTPMPPMPPPSPPNRDGLRFVAKIPPFAAAVALATPKEVITFGTNGFTKDGLPPRGGAMRRYSAETFKSLGTGLLANTEVYAAAVDEKGNRLVLLAARTNKAGAVPPGELRVYDLKAFLADRTPTPLATLPLGGGPEAMDLSADGTTVYAAGLTVLPGPRTGKGRSKILKVDAAKGVVVGETDTPGIVSSLRASPDGKHLFAGEMPVPPNVPPGGVAPPPAAGSVQVFDAAALKRLYAVALPPGQVTDIRFVADGKAVVATANAQNEARYSLVDAAGEATDLPVGLRFPTSGNLALTPDRKRLVASSGIGAGQTGTEVFVVAAGGGALRSAATMPLAPEGVLNGPVVVTPDGAHAVYGSGVVLDIAGVAEKEKP